MGADIDIRCSEPIATDKRTVRDGRNQHVTRPLEISVAHHAGLFGGNFHAQRPVDHRSLDRTGSEEKPTIIVGALVCRRRQARLGKGLRKIRADRCTFGDHLVAMRDGGNLAHRIDCEEVS